MIWELISDSVEDINCVIVRALISSLFCHCKFFKTRNVDLFISLSPCKTFM